MPAGNYSRVCSIPTYFFPFMLPYDLNLQFYLLKSISNWVVVKVRTKGELLLIIEFTNKDMKSSGIFDTAASWLKHISHFTYACLLLMLS